MNERHQKILIIDDDITVLSLVRTYLGKAGFDCVCASSGFEGLEKIRHEKPDLILLDYLMPDLDGSSVFQKLVTDPLYQEFKNIPVIIITAKDFDASVRTRMLESGVSAYLQKPFGLQELRNVIENEFIIHQIRTRNVQLQEEIRNTKDYLESLLNTAPIGIISTDRQGIIKRINSYFLHVMGLEEKAIVGQNILEFDVFKSNLIHDFKRVLYEDANWTDKSISYVTSQSERISLKVRVVPLTNDEVIDGLIITVQNITETERKQHELSMLSQISHFMHSTLQLDELLHLILTAMTAGCALGFSRAMILLINPKTRVLECKMGVGPANHQEASQIWSDLAKEEIALSDFLIKYGLKPKDSQSNFNKLVRKIKISMDKLHPVLSKIIEEKTPVKIHRYQLFGNDCPDFIAQLYVEEILAVPLIAKDKVIGMVVADNQFSNRPIDNSMIELLKVFANQAGIAIERAEAYQELENEKNKLESAYRELKDTQNRLIHAERLAVVGKMAAQIAHEVRNPLVAVGGFARNIQKLTDTKINKKKLKSYAGIIYDEVNRLENILSNVLDFSKLSQPKVGIENINKLIDDVCVFLKMRDEITAKKISLTTDLDHSLPPTYLDPQQIKQALLNICQNALHSMSSGGILHIGTCRSADNFIRIEIRDTGEGMPSHVLEEMFNPFFTTKKDGTGLGLPISQKIINYHGGEIDVISEVGKGTIFTISLKVFENIDQFYQESKTHPLAEVASS